MYLGIFNSKEDIAHEFKIDLKDLKDVKILYASYNYEDYSGSTFVLFKRNGKLYEVHGSHCSCYGLEGQWDPEETFVKAFDKRNIDKQLRGGLERWNRKNRKV